MDKQSIFETVVHVICEVIPELDGHAFQSEDRLVDLGANSIDRAEIITMSIVALSLSFPRVEFSEAKTMGELVRIISEKS